MVTTRNATVIAEIKKLHGDVIDLNKSPETMVEIIRHFGHSLDEVAGPDGTAGAPGGGNREVGIAAVLNLVLELKRDVQALHAKIK